MIWSWQQPDWPTFTWDRRRVEAAEQQFLVGGGMLVGIAKHLGADQHNQLAIEAMSTEALTTSEIEGEILDRASVQSSVRRQLGLSADARRVRPAEQGIAEVMVDLYRSFDEPLSPEMLFRWHRMVMRGRQDMKISDGIAPALSPCKLFHMHFMSPGSISRRLPRHKWSPRWRGFLLGSTQVDRTAKSLCPP